MTASERTELLDNLSTELNVSPADIKLQSVGGGCINETFKIIVSNKHTYFCKINNNDEFPDLFKKERNGLELVANHNSILAPQVINYFTFANHQVLVLEWIEAGTRTSEFWKTFGEQLAQLHSVDSKEFGLNEDNYMGSVKQLNEWKNIWSDFFRENRLEPLVEKCVNQQLLTDKHQQQFEKVYLKLPEVFPEEKPSLVHGDLWSGNFMCNVHAQPVLIDPAVYYGHRSVDLAMTTLFGGFDKGFYEAYNYNFPLPKNYKEQWEICNLYPLLIHLLLFGRSYLPQIQHTLDGFT